MPLAGSVTLRLLPILGGQPVSSGGDQQPAAPGCGSERGRRGWVAGWRQGDGVRVAPGTTEGDGVHRDKGQWSCWRGQHSGGPCELEGQLRPLTSPAYGGSTPSTEPAVGGQGSPERAAPSPMTHGHGPPASQALRAGTCHTTDGVGVAPGARVLQGGRHFLGT